MDQPTGEPRCCAVCGGPINRNNTLGICHATPECVRLRNEKARRARGIKPAKRGRTPCSVADCPAFVHAYGLCEVHNWRMRKHGDTGSAARRVWRVNVVNPGDVFGRWTALGRSDSSTEHVLCRCACGKERTVRTGALIGGTSTSCGCSRAHPLPRTKPYMPAGTTTGHLTALEDAWRAQDRIRFRCDCGTESVKTAISVKSRAAKSCGCLVHGWGHGLSRHPLYHVWSGMIDRTTNPARTGYASYGGRGITVCDRWRALPAFVEDIERDLGPRPGPAFSLDRIDNDGNYEPGNVQWADKKQQARNRRTTVTLTAERDALLELVKSLRAETGRLS